MKVFLCAVLLIILSWQVFADVKFSNASAACNGTTEGSQRYNSTSKKMEFCNGTSWAEVGSASPAGTVAFFVLGACPSGWTAYASALGRYIVGLPVAGTLEGTAGTALTNLQNRAVGQHNHSVNPPNTNTTTKGNHTHTTYGVSISGESGVSGASPINKTALKGIGTKTSSTAGNHNHAVNIAAFNSAN